MAPILYWLSFVAAFLVSIGKVLATEPYEIQIAVSRSGTAVVEYDVPSGVTQLHFKDAGEDVARSIRKPFWRVSDACASVLPDRISVAPGCTKVRVQVGWDAAFRSRTYPALIRLRSGGVLVYAGYLDLSPPPGGVTRWTIRGPPGWVVDAYGHKKLNCLTLPSPRDLGWVYVGPDIFRLTKNAVFGIEPGIAESVSQQVIKVVPSVLDLLARELGQKLPRTPRVFVTWENRDAAGKSFQADVAGGDALRIALFGEGWAHPDSSAIHQLMGTIAHEVAHLWNYGLFRPAPEEPIWLHEGNSELLSLLALRQLGLVTLDHFVERLQVSVNVCAILRATSAVLHGNENSARRAPYECGLAAEFALTTIYVRSGHPRGAFTFWRGFWHENRVYTTKDLIAYTAQASHQSVTNVERVAHAILDGSAAEMRSTLAYIGLTEGRQLAAPPRAVAQATLMHGLAALMSRACPGEVGIWSGPDSIPHLSNSSGCKRIKADIEIRMIEGIETAISPLAATRALAEACDKRHKAELGPRASAITMDCDSDTAAKIMAGISLVKLNGSAIQGVSDAPDS